MVDLRVEVEKLGSRQSEASRAQEKSLGLTSGQFAADGDTENSRREEEVDRQRDGTGISKKNLQTKPGDFETAVKDQLLSLASEKPPEPGNQPKRPCHRDSDQIEGYKRTVRPTKRKQSAGKASENMRVTA